MSQEPSTPAEPAPLPAAGAPPAWNFAESRVGPVLALVLAVAIAFSGTLEGAFVHDDSTLIVQDYRIRSLDNLGILWTGAFYGPGSPYQHYRPVTTTTFALDYAIWQLDPFGYHLTNLILHLAVVLAWWAWLRRLFPDGRLALIAALWFAVHPLQTEAVANIKGRCELLSLLFLLGSLHAHRTALTASRGRFIAWSALGGVLLLLGLLSKEGALVGPGLVLIADRAVPVHGTGRRTIVAVALGTLAVALFFVLHAEMLGSWGTGVRAYSDLGAGAGLRIPRALAVLGRSFLLHLAPTGMAADYALNHRPELLPIPWLHPAVLLGFGGLAALAIAAARRGSGADAGAVAFGAGWVILSLVPVSNLLVEIGIIQADRLASMASAGGLLLIACVLPAPAPAGRQTTYLAIVAAVLAASIACTMDRNADWASEDALCRDLLRKDPGNPAGHAGSAGILRDEGAFDEALAAAREAVRLAPRWANAWSVLGSITFARGEREASLEAYSKAIECRPLPAWYRKRAAILHALGRPDEARADLDRSLALAPDDPAAWVDHAVWLARVADPPDPEGAARAYAHALELVPTHAGALFQRGIDAMRATQPVRALADFAAAIRWDPIHVPARIHAAEAALASGSRLPDAAVWLEQALVWAPRQERAWRLLEKVCRTLGDVERLRGVHAKMREAGFAPTQD